MPPKKMKVKRGGSDASNVSNASRASDRPGAAGKAPAIPPPVSKLPAGMIPPPVPKLPAGTGSLELEDPDLQSPSRDSEWYDDEYSSSDEEVFFYKKKGGTPTGPSRLEEQTVKGWKRLYACMYCVVLQGFPAVYILVYQARVASIDSVYFLLLVSVVTVVTTCYCIFETSKYISERLRSVCCGPVLAAIWMMYLCWGVFEGMSLQASQMLTSVASIGIFMRFNFFPFVVPVVVVAQCQYRRLKRKSRKLAKLKARKEELARRQVPLFVWQMKKTDQQEWLVSNSKDSKHMDVV